MLWLIVGLILFLGMHSVRIISPGFRDAQLAAMGEGGWKGTHSLVSLIGLGLIIWGYYLARPQAGIIYTPPVWTHHLTWLLMAVSFALIPFNMRSSRLKSITEHPYTTTIVIWSFAHLLANGDSASVVLFGAFLIWSIATLLVRVGGAMSCHLWRRYKTMFLRSDFSWRSTLCSCFSPTNGCLAQTHSARALFGSSRKPRTLFGNTL